MVIYSDLMVTQWGSNGIYRLVVTNIAMENHHFQWENPLFLWPVSMAILTQPEGKDAENQHTQLEFMSELSTSESGDGRSKCIPEGRT